MQNCPRCQMLMDDHEVVCPTCAEQESVGAAGSIAAVAVGGPGAATAVLERPSAVPMPSMVRYRTPGEHRRTAGAALAAAALLLVVGVLVVMALRGDGPLADLAVQAGLAPPPVVDVPDAWTTKASDPGAFRVSMPQGATELTGTLDPQNPAAGSTYGFVSSFGDGGSATVLSTDFAMAPGTLAAMDDPAAFSGLVDTLSAGLEGLTDHGTVTVRREVPVGNGRAMDVVIVDDVEGVTTRVRYLLANDRVYAVVTSGTDEGAEQLDEVHARVLGSFEPAT